MSKQKLAENMKTLRLMSGYSINELASLVGRAPNTIINWESGKVSPDIEVVEKLCLMYNVPPDQILGWTPCPAIEEFLQQKQKILDELKELQQIKSDVEGRIKRYQKELSRKQ